MVSNGWSFLESPGDSTLIYVFLNLNIPGDGKLNTEITANQEQSFENARKTLCKYLIINE